MRTGGISLAKEKKHKIKINEEKNIVKTAEEKILQNENTHNNDKKIDELSKQLTAKDDQIEHLKADFQIEKEKNKDVFDKYLRLQAEFENFRKRMEKEKTDFLKYSMERFFRELIPVIDNFELALESVEKSGDLAGLTEGVKLIQKQLQDILQKEGLSLFSSVGEIFDPTKHEAVMQIESETHNENTIVEEFKKGYYLNDRLLRPAQVAVAKKKSPDN